MDLKNAIAVCLISLCSATLVVLIARSLDMQAAGRLEPHLVRIAEQLESLPSQNLTAGSGGASLTTATNDGVLVYYFHGNKRCPTCRAIESQSYATVHTTFGAQLEGGQLGWKILNYESTMPSVAELVTRFDVGTATVVLAHVSGGQVETWKRLDQVWALWNDKPAFAQFLQSEIDQMLQRANHPRQHEESNALPDDSGELDIPIPDEDTVDEPDSTEAQED